ncbi:SRPBCC family protein [Amycolatopsis sp. NPDC058986]|uniref:SRPBCC family protein n=1 Tax=unclassified Amycolatopsis TaxID=2618356 RepID=UPI003670F181
MTNPTTITSEPGTPFIDVVRDFDATPAQVYRVWSDPELVARWLGPEELTMELIEYDVRSGGGYRYVHRTAHGEEFRFRGVFHTAEPGERIIQTFEWDGKPGEVTLESVVFEDLGSSTRVRTHSVFPSVEARDGAVESGMMHGITQSMDRLAALLR